jgi:hypothetical protein
MKNKMPPPLPFSFFTEILDGCHWIILGHKVLHTVKPLAKGFIEIQANVAWEFTYHSIFFFGGWIFSI